MTHLQKVTLRAIFLSAMIHIVGLSFFSFRVPLQKPSFQPSLNFLGSFLTPYDTKIIKKNPHQIATAKQPVLALPKQQTKNPHINTETDRSLFSRSLPASKKKTLPGRLDTELPESVNIEKKETDEGSYQYTPLKLPDHDRY